MRAALHNGGLLNRTLNALAPGDTLIIPQRTFHVMGGILVQKRLANCTIRLDGTLDFSKNVAAWPRDGDGRVLACLDFTQGADGVTFTSDSVGTMQGNGKVWWGIPGIGYLTHAENRPRLFTMSENSTDVLLERWKFVQSPYWTVTFRVAFNLEIRHCSVLNHRRPRAKTHNAYELTAFNTDGFDLTGVSIWIHHCKIWTQDDAIAIKDNTEDVLAEHIEASGAGLSIGSIASTVRNITFRDINMINPYRGIYLKFRTTDAEFSHKISLIKDVLYENIRIENPEKYAVWIGPAQQSDSQALCAAHPCSICWPELPRSECRAVEGAIFKNIMLRDVTIISPQRSPGVVLADKDAPIQNVTFHNVVVTDPDRAEGDYHTCEGVAVGFATGNTNPVPKCFKDMTRKTTGVEITTDS
uniref:Pectate lyase superfamily protein domain-containing protein n=1 Tax=Corethron hystrix TaxID=216773 RepID=A0A7S1B9L9_9STRA